MVVWMVTVTRRRGWGRGGTGIGISEVGFDGERGGWRGASLFRRR
jgi:hypothetical protein